MDASTYKEKEIKLGFKEHDNKLQMCSCCRERLPEKIKRISFSVKAKFGYTHIRICERCVHILNQEKDLKNIRNWEEELYKKSITEKV